MNFGTQKGISPERLALIAQPKEEFQPSNIYAHEEFRGLLHADHQEAVANFAES
jgi:hypothetical protein